MKSSLKSILPVLALATLAVLPLARAQDAAPSAPPPAPTSGDDQAPPPPHHHHPRGLSAEQLKAKLNLTDAQFKQVQAIQSKMKEQMMALHDDDSLSDDDKRDKMHALMKSTHDQIRALLTADQQKIFDSLMPAHGTQPPPPPPPPPSDQ